MNPHLTPTRHATGPAHTLRACLSALALAGLLQASRLLSGVPEPDALLYGSITLDDTPVSSADSGVLVEARHPVTGQAVASYQMGSSPNAGNAYVLRIPMESAAPLLDPNASLAGDNLLVVVSDASGPRGQLTHTLDPSATARRLDLNFGSAPPDSDQDSLPDAWETAHFAGLGTGANTVMANGQTAHQNYVAGTDPNNPASVFEVQVSAEPSQTLVSFLARLAEGPGYTGRTRLYALESTTDFDSGWTPVPGYSRLIGNNQVVQFTATPTNPPAFYRGRVWLE